jgi:heptosyltransferase-3
MKAAVICSKGIGDGLLMMVASHRLLSRGYTVTTYQDLLGELKEWFPHHHFKKRPSLANLEEELSSYDFLMLQNDNTPLSNAIIHLYKKGKLHSLSVLYASYEKDKHFPLTSWDRVFNRSRPMVDNIAQAVASVLQCTQVSKNNGLVPPSYLKRSRHHDRILIHPTSTTPLRTWDPQKFLEVGAGLQDRGYHVSFCVSPAEHPHWKELIKAPFSLPVFPSLADLAAYVYESEFLIGNESGTGHLASNLHIPTLIIASSHKQMTLWRPGWFAGRVLTPHPLIPNFKGSRLREKKWQKWISSKQVIKTFESMRK